MGPNSSKHTTAPSGGRWRYKLKTRVALASNCGSVLRFHERVRWKVTCFSRRMQRSISMAMLGTTRRRSR
jgi:hypothetical protein